MNEASERKTEQAEQPHSDDDDESDSDEEQTKGPVKPNVDAAISALKADKESKRSAKLIKIIAKEQKKKGKKGGKGAAKSSAAASATGSTEQQEMKPTLGLDECDDFEPTISTNGKTKESRVKTAMDDFLCSVAFARRNLAAKIPDEEALRSKHFLVSLFLELAYNSQVCVNGKVFKVYSAFREECQKLFVAAHQRLQVGEETYDPLHLAKNLMSMVSTPASWLQFTCEL